MYVQVQLLGHVYKCQPVDLRFLPKSLNMNFENRVNVAKVTSRF